MKTKLIPMLLLLLVGAVLAAGCGDDDDEGGSDTGATAPAQTETQTTETAPEETTTEESGGGGAENVEIPADPGGGLSFTEETATAKAGEVTLSMPNESSVPHAIALRGGGVDESGETVQGGGTSEVTAELQAGEYEYYCPVGGHEQAGMKGTLTVE
jgi:plastocyanin